MGDCPAELSDSPDPEDPSDSRSSRSSAEDEGSDSSEEEKPRADQPRFPFTSSNSDPDEMEMIDNRVTSTTPEFIGNSDTVEVITVPDSEPEEEPIIEVDEETIMKPPTPQMLETNHDAVRRKLGRKLARKMRRQEEGQYKKRRMNNE